MEVRIPEELVRKAAEIGLDEDAVFNAAIEGVEAATDSRSIEEIAESMILMLPLSGGMFRRRHRNKVSSPPKPAVRREDGVYAVQIPTGWADRALELGLTENGIQMAALDRVEWALKMREAENVSKGMVLMLPLSGEMLRHRRRRDAARANA